MTTITLPRATVEQALEALEAIREADTAGATPKMVIEARSMYEPTITALRAALAQQAEPVEPVAWRYKYSDGFWRFSNGKRVNGCDPIESQALYTALAQQAEPVDTDCHTQGICQRSGYGIPKP